MRSSESPYRAAVSMWLTPWRSSRSSARSASAWVARARAAPPKSVTLLRWPVFPNGRRSIISSPLSVAEKVWGASRRTRPRSSLSPRAPGRRGPSPAPACGAPHLSWSGCVFPGQLRCRALELFLLPVQPGLPAPGALEVVPDVETQAAELLGLDLDPVPVLESAQAAMVRARRDDVAGVQRVDRGDPLDAARNLVGHVARVVVLLELAVHPELHLQMVRIGDLVGGHDVRPDRAEGVTRLHLVEGVATRRQAPGRAVDEVRVPEDVAHRLAAADRRRALADDERDLGLTFEDRRGHVGEHHGVAVTDDGVRRLVECVDGCRLGASSVFHVVHGHGDDVVRLRQGGSDPDLADRFALAAGGRALQPSFVVGG